MAWDFTSDSDKQTKLVNTLNEAADKYDVQIDNLYGKIDSMGGSWVGNDYDLFKEGTEGYRQALSDLSQGIRMYGEHFTAVANGTDELSTELINAVRTLTGEELGADGLVHHETVVLPGGNGATNNQGVATNSGTTPANSGTTPANSGTTPANNGVTPPNNGSTPGNSGSGGNATAASPGGSAPTQTSAKEVTSGVDIMGSTTYAQWESSGYQSCYLDDDMTILYQNGKILYPDGHYEEVRVNNLYDLEEQWMKVNNYAYATPTPAPVDYSVQLMGTTTYAQWESSGFQSCYLDDAMTIYYDNGVITYPDGHYENVRITRLSDLEEQWKKANGIQ